MQYEQQHNYIFNMEKNLSSKFRVQAVKVYLFFAPKQRDLIKILILLFIYKNSPFKNQRIQFLQYSLETHKTSHQMFKQKTQVSSKDNKQMSTLSSEQQKHYASLIRMINSQHLTPQMAINYLFQWRNNSKLLSYVLARIKQFCCKDYMRYVPVTVFILTLQSHVLFQKFCQSLANQSIPLYLIMRWAYSTYLHQNRSECEKMINKIDSSLIKRFTEDDFKNLPQEGIRRKIEQKVHLSNYSQNVNEFFERLFKIPQKLKKYDKVKRNEKLKEHLDKIYKKFKKQATNFIEGVAFPLDVDSPILLRIIDDECLTFSTKERVPFKLVFETISLEDAKKLKQGIKNNQSTVEIQKPTQQALILPKTYFGSQWKQHVDKIKLHSPYSNIPSYEIRSFMVKSGDDLRQEYMAMQLIRLIHEISIKQNLKLWVRPYYVIPYNNDSGLIQFVDDTKTVSYLKEKSGQKSLKSIYKQIFGLNWQAAVTNFIQSLAGYSLIQYLFAIKDRHNNNILIDTYGHIIHIDFSFIISSSPGNMGFEKAPFKLTDDYLQLMEGHDSDIFKHFKLLFFFGLKFIRKYKKEIMQSVIMMTHCPGMKCFQRFDKQSMQKRFHQNATDQELMEISQKIIHDSYHSYSTSNYDRFQWYTNFILP